MNGAGKNATRFLVLALSLYITMLKCHTKITKLYLLGCLLLFSVSTWLLLWNYKGDNTLVNVYESNGEDAPKTTKNNSNNSQKKMQIFYNRVPKCASTALLQLFNRISKDNKFQLVSSQIYAHERVNKEKQRIFVQMFTKQVGELPLLYERHINFINFSDFGHPNPTYINVIRDPLERLVSGYYYNRFHLSKMFPMDEKRRKMTYDECVQKSDPECVDQYFRVIPYFCGQNPKCRIPGQFSLDEAKRNVEKFYSVVGYSEELSGFLEVLEFRFPQYFRGIYQLFKIHEISLRNRFKTRGKIPPSNTTIAVMKTKLGYDYSFYNFIKQRFHNTWNHIKQTN